MTNDFADELRARLANLADHAPEPDAEAPTQTRAEAAGIEVIWSAEPEEADLTPTVLAEADRQRRPWLGLVAAAAALIVVFAAFFTLISDDKTEDALLNANAEPTAAPIVTLATTTPVLATPVALATAAPVNPVPASTSTPAPEPTPELGNTPASTPIPKEPVTTQPPEGTPTPLAANTPVVAVQPGTIGIQPAGPYVDGQEVRVLVGLNAGVDLFNWGAAPHLCAQVDNGPETCDPRRISAYPLDDTPVGTVGIFMALPRFHAGPDGLNDCAASNVSCRLVYNSNEFTGTERSQPLDFTVTSTPAPPSIALSPSDASRNFIVKVDGLPSIGNAEDALTTIQLRQIEDSVLDTANFDPALLRLRWHLGAPCSFGSGAAPFGSDDLIDAPPWWGIEQYGGDTEQATLLWNCDYQALEGNLNPLDPTAATPVSLRRSIYGYGGWVDCAMQDCFLPLELVWQYPASDGSTLGGEFTVAITVIDPPAEWPVGPLPTIRIVEPGPYAAGQDVTVEITNYRGGDSLAVAWCPGGDQPCGYRNATEVDDVLRITWTLPTNAADCGEPRCYFAINSNSEGLPPPAIVTVLISE